MVTAAVANSAWWAASAFSAALFARALHDPAAAQEKVLRYFITRNRDTVFGRAHGLRDIRNHDQFVRRVPARSYDEMLPWIDRIRRGEQNVLTRDRVPRLIPTSGSTAARKLIPTTAGSRAELNRGISPWVFDLYRQFPGALRGPAYWSITPVVEADISDGEPAAVPIGFDDDAAYLGGWRKRLVDAAMAVPGELKKIRSIKAWRYATLLLLLRRRDLCLISIWHPSFLQLLLDALPADWSSLLMDVDGGGCAVAGDIPARLIPHVIAPPDPGRARELKNADGQAVAKIWPMLKVISCWTDGNAGPAADALQRGAPGVSIQPKGLLATEGVVSIPYAGRRPLAIRSHFLEFEDEAQKAFPACELKPGNTYNIVLTTGGGLCRYRLDDLVQVDGFVGRTPSIRFCGKAGMISDRMGEKLTDGFVLQVLQELFVRPDARPPFTMLAADISASGCQYTLYVNASVPTALHLQLDTMLCANPQYAYCRRLGQILRPRVFRISGDAYVRYCQRWQEMGQSLGDIKPVALSRLTEWSNHFAGEYLDRP